MSATENHIEVGTDDLNTLKDIQKYILNEVNNLKKSRNRPRTLSGIYVKRENITHALANFERIVKKYEDLDKTEDWNELTDRLDLLKKECNTGFKILDETVPIKDKKKKPIIVVKPRSKSVTFADEQDSEDTDGSLIGNNLSHLSFTLLDADLFFSPITDSRLLSSTLNNQNPSENSSQLDSEEDSLSEGEDDPVSNENHIQNQLSEVEIKARLIKELLNFSEEFGPTYRSFIVNMVFNYEKAVKYIPDFRGDKEEVEGFIYQIEHIAKDIPKPASSTPDPDDPAVIAEQELIHIVLSKLKGPALQHFKRIRAASWNQVRTNLRKEFGEDFKLEKLFRQIEMLAQEPKETFASYKNRVLIIKQGIDEFENGKYQIPIENDSYAQRNLKLHFIAGLNNQSLKNQARNKKTLDLEQLIKYLDEECVDVEQLEHIEERIKGAQQPEPNDMLMLENKLILQNKQLEKLEKLILSGNQNGQQQSSNNSRQNYQNRGYRNNGFRNDYGNANEHRPHNYNGNGNRNNYRNNSRAEYDNGQFRNNEFRQNGNQNTRGFGNNNNYRNDQPPQNGANRNNYTPNRSTNPGYGQARDGHWANRNFDNNNQQKN